MKDIDFDELDQAVSSVLGDGPDAAKKASAPAAHTEPPKQPAAPASSPVAPTEPQEPAKTPAPGPAVSPAVKRRGQFLDMVHPSADMTNRPSMPTAATRTKIAPVSSDIMPEPPKKEATSSPTTPAVPVPPTPPASEPVKSEPAEVKEPETAVAPGAKDAAWPDPLDIASPASAADEEGDKAEPETSATPAASVAPAPATTPFVTDAKVDKRPLGAFGSAEVQAPEETPAKDDDPQTAPVVEEQKTSEPTPPELQPDVVSVEAAAEREFAGNELEPQEKPASNAGLSQSIPQQYQTPQEKPDTEAHPVFDTKEYHQPLLPAHNQKKGRGVLIVIIILLLLVVGAALGYFAFIAGF